MCIKSTLMHPFINTLYLGGRGVKKSLAAKWGGNGMGGGDDFENDSYVGSSSSESSDVEDARPRAKTVRSIIHEVGLTVVIKEV